MVADIWKDINEKNRAFIIAEAGVNHNGDIDTALKLVDKAVESGADAVKFQTFNADKLALKNAPKAGYQLKTTSSSESQYEMLKRLQLLPEDYYRLFEHCMNRNIHFISTPFDEDSADFLEELGVSVFKIPSGEITNIPYLKHIAKKGMPVILSTGMANLGEVEAAVECLSAQDNRQIILLHCVTNYPASPSDVNLRAMKTMALAFGFPTGYSDHTEGIEISLAAAALGAKVIEKHFTLDKNMEGPDHKASLEPAGLKLMIESIRDIESALGNGIKKQTENETDTAAVVRKSIVAVNKIMAGSLISKEDLGLKRPGSGMSPSMIEYITGRIAAVDIEPESLVTMAMLK